MTLKNGSGKYLLLLLSFLVLGFILRINNLSGRSLWTDEFFTLFEATGHGIDIDDLLKGLSAQENPELLTVKEIKRFLKPEAGRGVKDVSRGLLYTDTHAPLYFWMMHFWLRAFGDGVLALRMFSLLMGMASILLAYRIGSYLFSGKSGLFAALFMSISAFSVRYAQEARPYALVMVLGLSSWLFMLKFQRHNRNSDILCFAVTSCLGMYVHYFYIFLAFAQFAYFTVLYFKDSAKLDKFYLAFLSSLLLFSPWAILLILKGYKFYLVEWLFGYPGFKDKIYYLSRGLNHYIFMPGVSKGTFSFVSLAGSILLAYLAVRAAKEIFCRYLKEASFCLVMFLVPLLGMLFMDIVQQGALLRQERFWTFSFLGFIPLAGYFLYRGFLKDRFVVLPVIILMLVSSFGVSSKQFGPSPAYASDWINKESKGTVSAVIVNNIRSVVFSQAYYLDDGIYMIPVSSQKELESAVQELYGFADKFFIARHYHPSDPALMNRGFLETKELPSGFKLKAEITKDDISVSEFVK